MTVADEHGASGPGLNLAQARALKAAFAHVSDLLEGVLRIAQGDITPFDRQRPDLTPEEAKDLTEVVPAIRTRMLEALAQLDIPAPAADRSGRWTIRTALSFADLALSEVTPAELVGYGSIDEEAAQSVTGVVTDLRKMIAEAQDALRRRESETSR